LELADDRFYERNVRRAEDLWEQYLPSVLDRKFGISPVK
jgi:hypothetical protein